MSWICPSCNSEESNDTFVRCSCGYEVPETVEPDYTRLGGALVLVLIGVIVNISIHLFNIFVWFDAFISGASSLIDKQYYWSIFITILSFVMLFLLIKKSKIFPALMLTFYALSILWTSSYYLIVKSMTNLPNYYDHLNSAIDKAVVTFVICAVWSSYFIFSKRVKNTFVN